MQYCTILRDSERASFEEMREAARNLSGNAFKLYWYIQNFTLGAYTFSKQLFANELGISNHAVTVSLTELEKKGYLILKRDMLYDFYIKVENSYNKEE